jgi:transposase-like protein
LVRSRATARMNLDSIAYRGYRCPPHIITHAVRLYHRCCLSLGDVQDLLAKS